MKKEITKSVTTRFSIQDYLQLEKTAEECGCTIADIVRKSWAKSQEQRHTSNLLAKLEQRQRQSTFEMLNIILALKPEERKNALEQLNKKGIKW